ncbi:MAG: DUF4184 family protein, partial [Gammaproteobacteria bacterium]|nr:DUF4184 family protein [Gammaproteobacteria bacterium]
LPFLDDYYGPELIGHPIHLYRWLQHGSSLLGLAAVVFAVWHWTRGAAAAARAPGEQGPGVAGGREFRPQERLCWLAAYVAVPALVLAGALLLGYPRHSPWTTLGEKLTNLAVIALDGAAISLLLVSALIRLRSRCGALDG